MFNYVYKIEFGDNTYYYGSRGCKRLPTLDTGYISSSRYVKAKIKAGESYTKTILETFDNRGDAYKFEYDIIAQNIQDVQCLNKVLSNITAVGRCKKIHIIHSETGKRSVIPDFKFDEYHALGFIKFKNPPQQYLSKDGKNKKVNLDEVDSHLKDGWVVGCKYERSKYKWMVNTTEDVEYLVPEKQVPEFKDQGYIFGRCSTYKGATLGLKYITNGETTLSVDKSELGEYLANGWVEEGPRKGDRLPSKWMFNASTNHSTYVELDKVAEFEANGYKIKYIHNKSKGRIWVFNEVTNERTAIYEHDRDEYLNKGWKLGYGIQNTKGRIWVNDGVRNYMMYPDDPNISNYVQERLPNKKKGSRKI